MTDIYSSVVQLCSRYALGVDTGDAPVVAGCFAADGVLKVNGEVATSGAEAIAERLTSRSTPGVLHTTTGLVLRRLDGDRHSAASYFFLFDTQQGRLTAAGRYDDVVEVAPGSAARLVVRDVIWMWRES